MIVNVVFLFSLFMIIDGQNTCTVFNKCGSHGYCTDGDNQTQCTCKFWWTGELCNEQTNDGVQVIILGSLTAALVFLYYGLNLGRKIYRKCKSPKENKIEESPQDSKLLDRAMNYMQASTRSSSCLTTILMIIVASGTLVAKWSIIQPIHNGIVKKYKNQEPIYYQPNSFCDLVSLQEFDVVTFPVALFLILICIILTKRLSFMRNQCHGYGGLPIPVDFLSLVDRKLVAFIFAMIADELIRIFDDISGSSVQSGGILVRFLRRLYQVLIMGCRFYPILASVKISSVVTLTCATLYVWLHYSFTIITQGMCNLDYYPTYAEYLADPYKNSSSIQDKLDYYGTGPPLIVVQLITDVPRYLCLAYVSVKLPILLVRKILMRRKTNLSSEQKMLMAMTREETILIRISHPNSVEMRYVQNLFYPPNQRPQSRAICARLLPKFIYEWRDDFRFSSRILCIYSSVFLLLYYVTIRISVKTIPTLYNTQTKFQGLIDFTIPMIIQTVQSIQNSDDTLNNTSVYTGPVIFIFPDLVISYICAATMTVTIIVIQLIVLLVNIRRNLLQVYRGDDSEISRRDQSRYVSYASGNFRFAGYFIGYMIWGFLILAGFSTVVCICLGTLIVNNGSWIIEQILKAIIPGLLLAVFKTYLNNLFAQYIFLQHFGEVLALNNRRLFMIFMYFNFFLDAYLGLISAILRVIESFLGTIFYMSRLDYASVGRKLEVLDSGFSSYSGFIHTECTHRHPVMLVFVSHLFNQLKQQQYAIKHLNSNDMLTDANYSMKKSKSLRWIRKWRLAAFLVRNPAILFFRKVLLKQLPLDARRNQSIVDVDNQPNLRQALGFFVHQMAAQRASVTTENYPDAQRASVTTENYPEKIINIRF